MNYYLITLENFAAKVNQRLTSKICLSGSKGRNETKRSAYLPRSFHQAGQKIVASLGQTVAFCQVICKRSQEPASCP
jgi:hypothetical protein